MCSDRARTPKRQQRGYTLLELTITMLIVAAITLLVERTLTITNGTDRYLDARQRTQHQGGIAAYELYRGVSSSRRVFGRDAVGNGYAAALDLSRARPVAAVRLPLPSESGALGPDVPGDPRTGNALLFVREADPAACPTDPSEGRTRFVDVYRFECWYPHESDANVVPEDPRPALDLCVWRSIGFPSYVQLMAIEDVAERTRAVQYLVAEYGYEHAWDPSQPVDGSFYALDGIGTVSIAPETGFRIREDVDRSEGGRLVYVGVQLARTDPASVVKRAVFTTDDPASWVPDGLEVKSTGPSGHRNVWIRLTVEAPAGQDRTAAFASTLIASARDL